MFLALFCTAIVCVPLLIVSFLYDAIPYDLGRVQRDLQSAYSLRAKQVCIRQRGRLKPGDDHHCGSPALCCLVSPRGKRLPHSRLVRTLRLSLLLFYFAFLSFRKEKQANESQLPEGYSSAPRPCQRAAQNGRFPYEPPVFSCNASCAGGKRLAPPPRQRLLFFLQRKEIVP